MCVVCEPLLRGHAGRKSDASLWFELTAAIDLAGHNEGPFTTLFLPIDGHVWLRVCAYFAASEYAGVGGVMITKDVEPHTPGVLVSGCLVQRRPATTTLLCYDGSGVVTVHGRQTDPQPSATQCWRRC